MHKNLNMKHITHTLELLADLSHSYSISPVQHKRNTQKEVLFKSTIMEHKKENGKIVWLVLHNFLYIVDKEYVIHTSKPQCLLLPKLPTNWHQPAHHHPTTPSWISQNNFFLLLFFLYLGFSSHCPMIKCLVRQYTHVNNLFSTCFRCFCVCFKNCSASRVNLHFADMPSHLIAWYIRFVSSRVERYNGKKLTTNVFAVGNKACCFHTIKCCCFCHDTILGRIIIICGVSRPLVKHQHESHYYTTLRSSFIHGLILW